MRKQAGNAKPTAPRFKPIGYVQPRRKTATKSKWAKSAPPMDPEYDNEWQEDPEDPPPLTPAQKHHNKLHAAEQARAQKKWDKEARETPWKHDTSKAKVTIETKDGVYVFTAHLERIESEHQTINVISYDDPWHSAFIHTGPPHSRFTISTRDAIKFTARK